MKIFPAAKFQKVGGKRRLSSSGGLGGQRKTVYEWKGDLVGGGAGERSGGMGKMGWVGRGVVKQASVMPLG
ncbi:hypothetical protein E2C01_067873 [Portunus trituberculatus]|uniref:Uncharacterized protein n=1 Tax=Portunus trituberculatus TaxID=210409 RepID=A0A5B7HM84_PORTR|nr:hypothetical protein [Portunus trituberculatus]